jgi:Tol biopolymer transport system component
MVCFLSTVSFAAEWASGIRRIPIETNFVKFPQVIVSKKTLSNYSSVIAPLYPNNIPLSDIIFNKDMSRSILVSPEDGIRMIYFDRDANILQEFTKINRRIFSASLSEKGDQIFFTSDRNIGEKKIYLAYFSNFAQDPNYQLSFAVDSIGNSEYPSVNGAGTRMVYQSAKDGFGPRIYVAELGSDHKIASEEVVTHFTDHAYFPKLCASGRYMIYYLKSAKGYQIIWADIQEKRNMVVWDGAELYAPYDINSEGDRIVFQSPVGSLNDVFSVDIKKNTVVNLSARNSAVFGDYDAINSEDSHVTVSDDGTVVAYECQGQWDQPGVKVVDFRTKKTYFIYDVNEFKRKPQVSRDGESLVFLIDAIHPMIVNLKKIREM